MKLDTKVIHPKGFHEHEKETGAVIAPISLSTTFAQIEPAKPIGVTRKLSFNLKFQFVGIRVFPIGQSQSKGL